MIKKTFPIFFIALSLAFSSANYSFAAEKKMTIKEYIAQANTGSPYAAFRTGLAYEYGVGGLTKDRAKAIYYYKISDKNGNIKAASKLGGLYLNNGYSKDALPYLLKAVKAGDPLGQAYLGKWLENDKKTASSIKMYEASSKSKNPLGQFYYGSYLVKNNQKNKQSEDFLKGYALLALSAQKNEEAKNFLTLSKEKFTAEQKQVIAKYINEYK